MATILVVDEDITLLAGLGAQLEAAGYTVHKTSDSGQVDLLVAEQRPDLMILEVRTNRDGGWGVLQRYASQLPVIVLSRASREEDVVRGLEAGAADYLAKPYRSNELLTRVRVRLPRSISAASTPATELQRSDDLLKASTPPTLPTPPTRDVQAEVQVTPRSEQPMAVESVFMSEAEEMALLRRGSEEIPQRRDMLPQHMPNDTELTLGQRLHAERQRRRLTLVQAENELKIRMSYLQAMEDDKFTLLPSGPLTGQMLRSYASYLGLDTAVLMDEYKRVHVTTSVEPTQLWGGIRRPRVISRWMVVLLAVVMALVLGFGAILYFDPGSLGRVERALRALIVAPQATPLPTLETGPLPTTAPSTPPAPTVAPTSTPPASPLRTPQPPG